MEAWVKRIAGLRRIVLAIAGRLTWLPPTLARVSVGWLFLWSGWGKLNSLPDVIEFFRGLGIPAPEFQAPLAAGAEFVCGALLLVGLLSRVAAVPLIITMIVAIATAKSEELTAVSALFGFTEYLYILLLVYIGANGPGPLSLDAVLTRALRLDEQDGAGGRRSTSPGADPPRFTAGEPRAVR